MRKIVRASMLVLVLAVSAHAGNMGYPVAPPPPPPPANAMQTSTEPTTGGDMGDPKGEMGNPVTDSATEIGLNLLLTLLSLF